MFWKEHILDTFLDLSILEICTIKYETLSVLRVTTNKHSHAFVLWTPLELSFYNIEEEVYLKNSKKVDRIFI